LNPTLPLGIHAVRIKRNEFRFTVLCNQGVKRTTREKSEKAFLFFVVLRQRAEDEG
jgi:hypothetical protein